MANQEKQLKGSTIWLMIGVALFYDALSILLGWIMLGWLLIPIFYLTYYVWFKMYGISFFSKKRATSHLLGGFFEVVSAGVVPAMTFIVARIALTAKIEGGVVESKVASMTDYRSKKVKGIREDKSVEKDKAA